MPPSVFEIARFGVYFSSVGVTPRVLHAHGIKNVLVVGVDASRERAEGVEYSHVACAADELAQTIYTIVEYIAYATLRQHKILVVTENPNVSATVAAAWIVGKFRMPAALAASYVRQFVAGETSLAVVEEFIREDARRAMEDEV